MQEYIEHVRFTALQLISKINFRGGTIYEVLSNIDYHNLNFEWLRKYTDQIIIDLMRRNFDFRKLFIFAGIMEKMAFNYEITIGEIIECSFVKQMVDKINCENSRAKRKYLIQQIIEADKNHCVILVNDVQIDPRGVALNINVIHPIVDVYPLWEYLTSAILFEKILRKSKDYQKCLVELERIKRVCKNTVIYLEYLLVVYYQIQDEQKIVETIEALLNKRSNALLLAYMYRITQDKKYKESLENKYSQLVTRYILKKYIPLMKSMQESKIDWQ